MAGDKMEVDVKLNMSLDQILEKEKDSQPSNKSNTGPAPVRKSLQGNRGQKRVRDAGNAAAVSITVARRVYVNNLSWRTGWQELKDHFRTVGNVMYADVLSDKANARSKGCGIVEFETPNEAARAIRELHQSTLDGRTIYVREDREDPDLGGGGGGFGGNHEEAHLHKLKRGRNDAASAGVTVGRRVYVSNLPYDVSWKDLKDLFSRVGYVVRADVIMDDQGNSKGSGIVEFSRAEDALRAISQISNSEFKGRQVFVREDRDETRGMPSPRFSQGAAPGMSLGKTAVVFQNLPWSLEWQNLKDLARKAGAVLRADIAKDHDGRSKGFGIVTYEHPKDAKRAIQMLNGTEVDGRVIAVKMDARG